MVGLLRDALSASGLPAPRIAYLGAASGDDAGFFRRLSSLLQQAGARDVVLARTCGRGASWRESAQAALAQADAVFVSGGDVDAGMRALAAAGVIPALQERFAAGVPFLGLSAGSIMLGREWITWDDPDDDATARPFTCLGFAPLICDTHAEDDDWSELRALLALRPVGTRGYGVTAPAMLRVHPDGRVEAFGGDVACLANTADGVRFIDAGALYPRLAAAEQSGRARAPHTHLHNGLPDTQNPL
jgi:cyanophycinase-like exopeptidase